MSSGPYQGEPLKLMEVGVILLLCFLLAIFVTVYAGAFHRPRRGHQRTRMIANARSISLSITDGYFGNPRIEAWMTLPPPVDYAGTSTDFLTALVTNGYLNVQASFFGGGGVPVAPGRVDDGTFTSGHNAWRIVAGVSVEDLASTPLVISRNLDAAYTNLSARVPTLDRRTYPFLGEGLVVGTVGGSAMFIAAKDLALEWHQLYSPATIPPTRILPE